jgi:hypothetical protein
MPWCTGCDRFLSPNTVLADGTCPTCHRPVDQPSTAAAPSGAGSPRNGATTAPDATDVPYGGAPPEREHTPIPWHLWLLIAALVVYLGYRAFQGLELLFG